jgi:hypothetical protein
MCRDQNALLLPRLVPKDIGEHQSLNVRMEMRLGLLDPQDDMGCLIGRHLLSKR